jgi:hypothetical protein
MAHPRMPPVERLGIPTIQLSHTEGQIRLRRFHEEMIVIIHQTIRMAEPSIAIDDMREQGEKLRAVTVIGNDILPSIAATRDMIDGVRELDA